VVLIISPEFMFKKPPGTTGTLFAWASFLLLPAALLQPMWFFLFFAATFALGVWACQRTGRDLGVVDHGSIVWDEVVPFWGVLWFTQAVTSNSWLWQLVAFLLFRVFDVLKPQPARYFDVHVKNGFGVMTDDFFAAIYAVAVLAVLVYFVPL
jgi:phosphatidylglycerophosphatase A